MRDLTLAIFAVVILTYLVYFVGTYLAPAEVHSQIFPLTRAPGNISCYKPHYTEGPGDPPLCCWNIKEIKPDVFLGCVR